MASLVAATMPLGTPFARAGSDVTFMGGGYGHSVGMPQYGAQAKALEGDSAEEIVEYYYTGTSVVDLETAVGSTGSPLLDYDEPLWLGVDSDVTVSRFKPRGGELTICQPSVGCPLDVRPQDGENWRIKLKSNGKCVFQKNGVDQADPGECKASIKRVGSARIEFPNLGRTLGHGVMRLRPNGPIGDPASIHISFSMDLEEYLLGIAESFNWWEPAALEAQAIASRSYAVAKAHQRETGARSANGVEPGLSDTWKTICWCHIRRTTADQNYAGWGQTQSASWSSAVAATSGQVLTHPNSSFTYRGVVDAFYSSSSGGVTETNVGGFGSSTQFPYLQSVPDPWSTSPAAANPFATWTAQVSVSDVVAKLRQTSHAWKVNFDSLLKVEMVSGPPETKVRFTGSVGGSSTSVVVPGWWLKASFGLRSPQIAQVEFEVGQLLSQDLGAVPSSVEPGDRFGNALASGDFDGDGFLDLAIAAPKDGIGAIPAGGLVNVLYGTAQGVTDTGSQMFHEDIAGIPGQAEAGDMMGAALGAGDFDGDGFADLAIGIPNQGRNSKKKVGTVLVVFGSGSGLDPARSYEVGPGVVPGIGQTQAKLRFGSALATGDFDGDGQDDLAVGAPGRLVGGQTSAGKVVVLTNWSGSGFADVKGITQAGNKVPGSPSSGDEFGASVASGDINGDGFDDLIAGAPNDRQNGKNKAGLVIAFNGSTLGIRNEGSVKLSQSVGGIDGSATRLAQFGSSVALGDANGDGFDDLVVGAPGDKTPNGQRSGSATVVYGSASGLSSPSSKRLYQGGGGMPGTPVEGEAFGSALATGDVDNDGFDDVLVGIPGEASGGVANAGMIRLVRGSSSGLKPGSGASHSQSSAAFGGQREQGDRFGLAVGLWDLNGDQFSDRVVGVPFEDVAAIKDGGVAHVVYGT